MEKTNSKLIAFLYEMAWRLPMGDLERMVGEYENRKGPFCLPNKHLAAYVDDVAIRLGSGTKTKSKCKPVARPKKAVESISDLNHTKTPKKDVKSIVGSKESKTDGSRVWQSYSLAYRQRYDTDPVRNAKTNSLCKQLVQRLGIDAAVCVAQFYVSHNANWYVTKCHALEYCIKDAEKLHTEWKKGAQMTSTMARQADQSQSRQAAMKEMFKRIDNGEF